MNLLNKLSCFCTSIAWVMVHHNTQYLFSLMQNDLQNMHKYKLKSCALTYALRSTCFGQTNIKCDSDSVTRGRSGRDRT